MSSTLKTLLRLILSIAAGAGTAVAIAIIYAIADLYLSGHGYVSHALGQPEPWHHRLANLLLMVLAPGVAIATFILTKEPKKKSPVIPENKTEK